MRKKYQVFVSSTYTDLIEERQEAVSAILDAGHIPAGMELFKSGREKLATIQKWIDDSDIFLLILGGRYGSIDKESGKSYTQMEYEYAMRQGKPVFAIILTQTYLYSKAAKKGKSVFEQDHIDEYKKFRELVDANVVFLVDTIEGISRRIISQLSDMTSDPDYDLTGWVKSDAGIVDLSKASDDVLERALADSLKGALYHQFGIDATAQIGNQFYKGIISAIRKDGLLESFHRVVQFEDAGKGLIKVTNESTYKYLALKEGRQSYGFGFQASKTQAESFRIEKLIINSTDYTNKIEVEKAEDRSRGQLSYHVGSKKSIEIAKIPCQIDVVNSFVCDPLEFFQEFGLPYACGHFVAEFILRDGLEKRYEILSSTMSPFSSSTADSYQANEIRSLSVFRISLPQWTLAGSGYTVTLKPKAVKEKSGLEMKTLQGNRPGYWG